MNAFSLLSLGHAWPPSTFIIGSNVFFLFCFDRTMESLSIYRVCSDCWYPKQPYQCPTTSFCYRRKEVTWKHIHIKNRCFWSGTWKELKWYIFKSASFICRYKWCVENSWKDMLNHQKKELPNGKWKWGVGNGKEGLILYPLPCECIHHEHVLLLP